MNSFDDWNILKNKLNNLKMSINIKERSVYFINNKNNCAILSQIRLFDTKRILNKIGVVSINDFFEIKKRIKQMLD